MNRNCYRLVFNPTLGAMVPAAETARRMGKAASSSVVAGVVLAVVALSTPALAELPNPVAGSGFVTAGNAATQVIGNQLNVNQVGNKSILNWQTFNISNGSAVQFRQVDNLTNNNLVQGANFTSLNRIWDINPSVIAGSISQATQAGQKANIILVNTNGIAFMGGAQVNVNSFTASSLAIADNYVLNSLLGDVQNPQFQGTEGFVKVFEGAKISAGSQGRVMLIAPTVINKGTIEAPDGQIILAAGTKAYLRQADDGSLGYANGLLVEVDSPENVGADNAIKDGVLDGQTVALGDAENDKLGQVTNDAFVGKDGGLKLGELTAARGNVTMVGYAVNQMGIARATSSVVSNGSVYLMAKDTAEAKGSSKASSRGGKVVVGANSRTEVVPEVSDKTASVDGESTGSGMTKPSEVFVLGQTVYVAGTGASAPGAVIRATGGKVDIVALDNPKTWAELGSLGDAISTTARLHIGSGATIDVAGVTNVEVSAARNSVEVELRGDELKDSPVNRSAQGPLRGEKVYVDIAKAQANEAAGLNTLIAKDSLKAYQDKLTRTVAERSAAGGTVNIRSQGETILEKGVTVDVSGGSLAYTAANMKTTLLTTNGKLVDIADAKADIGYDGISTRVVVSYDKWNKKEVIDLGQSLKYQAAYTEGKDAGSLNIQSMGAAFIQPDVQGRTTVGEYQRAGGSTPQGATLTLGSAGTGEGLQDYKINQKIILDRVASSLPANFGQGSALPAELKNTLAVDAALLAKDKVATLKVYTNQAAEVRSALSTAQGGGVTIVANDLKINANMDAPGGTIDLAARNNSFVDEAQGITGAALRNNPLLQVADGVQLTAQGAWVNEKPGVAAGDGSVPILKGGMVKLAAGSIATAQGYETRGTVSLGKGVTIDVSGGARLGSNGKVTAGNGGTIGIEGYAVEGLNNNVSAYGVDKGGTLNLTANRVKVGGIAEDDFGTLNLAPDFFTKGGFANYAVTALATLEVAKDTVVQPKLMNRELLGNFALQATGSKLADFTRLLQKDELQRQATNLSLSAKQKDVGTGSLLIETGARVELDHMGVMSLDARNTVDIEGTLVSHGGIINVGLDNRAGDNRGLPVANTLWLGKEAVLDVSGVARTYVDENGYTKGQVPNGGTVNLTATTGYVVAQEGARINLNGAAPVQLDLPNENAGLGRAVGSDAGKLTLFAEEGILFDAQTQANAGTAANRGGELSVTLSKNARVENQAGFDSQARTLNLASGGAAQTAALVKGAPIPLTGTMRARIDTAKLEAAGFDRMRFSSRDAIVLEDGLNLGATRALPIQDLTLDAARVVTTGGDAALRAYALRMGNYDTKNRVGSDDAYTTTGTLTADATMVELAGNLRLRGMARSELTGTETVRFAGVLNDKLSATGASTADYVYGATIDSTGDLTLKSAVTTPGTYTTAVINAVGKTVRFEGVGNAPVHPMSAVGSLEVNAANIVQDGNVWAPLGSISFTATDALTLTAGSVTSVAAAPGTVLPFGQVQNGRDWVVNVDPKEVPRGQIKISALPEKSVRLKGNAVDTQPGATVNLSGGGDLQAYEFTAGPGGSRDMLTDANTYAVLPSYKGGFAPTDPQEKIDRASGTAVYLSGVPGLADGTYTLLPAHYALLPGAFAVRLGGTSTVMPGQAYTKPDGVRVASGYITDTRANAPRDANWRGIEVLTRAQVQERSELTLTSAAAFFSGGNNLPQDAGLLSLDTQTLLNLDANYLTNPAAGGRGMALDISVPNLVITAGTPTGLSSDATGIDVAKINALGAESVLLGATRKRTGDTTTLAVGANQLTLANDAAHPLRGAEVMLAAKDTITLKSGSMIDAQGRSGDAGAYTTEGDGAFVRAASTTATFERTGSPTKTTGTLVGEAGTVFDGAVVTGKSLVRATNSIVLDATKANNFKGNIEFSTNDKSGNLAVGADTINFGDAPTTAEGITYTQEALNELSTQKSLSLTSYGKFDVYNSIRKDSAGNDVNLRVGYDKDGNKVLQNLALQGAGLNGVGIDGDTVKAQTVTLGALKNVTLSNTASSAFGSGTAVGSGTLDIQAATFTQGEGDKKIQGFSKVTVNATELIGSGKGTTTIAADTTVTVARVRGEKGSEQTLTATDAALVLAAPTDVNGNPVPVTLDRVTALGAKWKFEGSSVDFNTQAVLPTGALALIANGSNPDASGHAGGYVELGKNAVVDVAGREVAFFDTSKPTWGGTVELASGNGNVSIVSGAKVDVSGAAGADGGTLKLTATKGTVTVANGSVIGNAAVGKDGKRGDGARAIIDTARLASFSDLNTAMNSGGFDGVRDLRVRMDNVNVAEADTSTAKTIRIAADSGDLNVNGTLDASGEAAGRIELFAKDDVNIQSNAKLNAVSSGAGKDGGDIEIGTREGSLNLANATPFNVSGGASGAGGTVLLRAPRTGTGAVDGSGAAAGTDVAISALPATVAIGARSVAVEAVKVYKNIATLNFKGTASDTNLTMDSVNTHNTTFSAQANDIKTRLGKLGDPSFHLLNGVEVQSSGDLTLVDGTPQRDKDTGKDTPATEKMWNLKDSRAGGEAGVLTLSATGNLNISSNLSDGFDIATRTYTSNSAPAKLVDGDSWAYRLIAGADASAANPMGVKAPASEGTGTFTLAANKLIRTGTGDIRIAAGEDIKMGSNRSVIYTAGNASSPLPNFTAPIARQRAYFTQGGGDVSLAAMRDVKGIASGQLYSDWLFRQGQLTADGSAYDNAAQGSLGWWVRFDQFQQGIGALGGGNVNVSAGREVSNLSASAPTQGRMASATPDAAALVKTGGGTVRVEAGADLLGGQYYADNGDVLVKAGGQIGSGQRGINDTLYTIIGLGDGQANVRAQRDVDIQTIVTPQMITQTRCSNDSTENSCNVSTNRARTSYFSTYTDSSGASLNSLYGNVNLYGSSGLSDAYKTNRTLKALETNVLTYLPPTLRMTAFQGNVVSMADKLTLQSSASGQLEMLAQNSVRVIGPAQKIVMSDRDSALTPSPIRPTQDPSFIISDEGSQSPLHAVKPVHTGDVTPVRIYANEGDVQGTLTGYVDVPKAISVRAGRDVTGFNIKAQHVSDGDVSVVEAGRDVVYGARATRDQQAGMRVGGRGKLQVVAGRNIDLGASDGIVSRGDLDNSNLPSGGASIQLMAGAGTAGLDAAGAINRLIGRLESGTVDEPTLWLARWLTGNTLLAGPTALTEVRALAQQSPAVQRQHVSDLVFTALRTTGRDHNEASSPFAGSYDRGYAALDLVFPGIRERNADATFKNYQGDINIFASRIATERGGDIDFMIPGGNLIVGLANTPEALVGKAALTSSNSVTVLGIVAAAEGDIKGFSRGDMLVNQSRILTVGGGDVMLWSSEGDIDAGKGKKTASAVPPPIVKVDSQGNVTQELQGAASGSGIGALSTNGIVAGDVDLIAPKGTVNAGDAGIRAGNINIAALTVVGGDNISVTGTSAGVAVVDTSAISATASGATSAGNDLSKTIGDLTQAVADSAKNAQDQQESFKPTFVRVDVLGYGE